MAFNYSCPFCKAVHPMEFEHSTCKQCKSKIVIDGPYSALSIKIYDLKARLVVEDFFSDNSYEVGSVIHEQGMYFYIISEESKVLSVGKFINN